MSTNLVISGGPGHDFAATTEALTDALDEVGVVSTVFTDPHRGLSEVAAHPGDWAMVTVNALRWQMGAERYAAQRADWAFSLCDHEAEALSAYVGAGGGLLAMHTAAICFDAHRLWAECIGGTWNWDRSSHPPESQATVSVTRAGRAHELTAGISSFVIEDEIYGFLDYSPEVVALLTSPHGGADHPVFWARSLGRGRVVTDLLGHSAAAINHPLHRQLLQRSARWLTTHQTFEG